MNTVLDPLVSEFETEEQAADYERWLHEKVQKTLTSPKPRLPHDQALMRVDQLLAERRKVHAAN